MTSTTVFTKYNSIKNVCKKTAMLSGFVPITEEWVADEKIHGANFSFIITPPTIVCARRSGELEKGEKFYEYEKLLEKFTVQLLKLYDDIGCNSSSPLKSVTVYGEIFGGIYPGKKQTTSKVQKEVYYSPDIHFFPFDIKIENVYMNYEDSRYLLEKRGFICPPRIAKGSSLVQLIKDVSPVFITHIPHLFDLELVPENYSEGLVIRPMHEYTTSKGSRVIFKHKNVSFSEVKPKTINLLPKEEKLSDDELAFFTDILRYMTHNRLNNILSHQPQSQNINVHKLGGLLCSDILKEYREENDVEEFFLSKNTKSLKKKLHLKCVEFVKNK